MVLTFMIMGLVVATVAEAFLQLFGYKMTSTQGIDMDLRPLAVDQFIRQYVNHRVH